MKEPHKIGYKVLLTILKPIYKLYYRPTIINKEAIPNEGPVIICSNHIHLFDQNTALISTNRMIHYMAGSLKPLDALESIEKSMMRMPKVKQ